MKPSKRERPKTAENSSEQQFSALWEKLNYNQRRFVVAMQSCSTKAEAAQIIGMSPDRVYHWPETVDRAIELLSRDIRNSAVEILISAVAEAAMVKLAGLDSKNEKVRQDAASEVLDRILGRAIQKQEIQIEDVSLTDEERVERILALLDAARARRDRQASDS